MKDEIKQMIDNLKFISEQESATIEINQNGCKVILDYITNLQEENETLKKQEKVSSDMSKEYYMRNKKAIKFIEEFIQEDYYEKLDEYITHFTWNTTKEDLLNILNGGDKE